MTSPVDELLDDAPFTPLHRRVWLLSSMGIMLDGFDFFIMGVAIPLIRQEWAPPAWQIGLVGSAAIVGAIVGAVTLGTLADSIGRRRAFRIDLGMFVAFALASALAPGVWWLIAFRFLLGVGIGADYPISSAYVAEVSPRRDRTRLLIGAFSFQAVGQLLGVLVGLALLSAIGESWAWRPMLAFGVVPAALIVVLRRQVPESPKWLADHGREEEAATVLSELLRRPVAAAELTPRHHEGGGPPPQQVRWRHLFSPELRRTTAFVSVPWFLMDVATYGVGVFTPTILAVLIVTTSGSATPSYIDDAVTATLGAAFVDVFLVVGFVLALVLVVRVGMLRLQLLGFVVMAGGLSTLALASALPGGGEAHLPVVFLGFAAFNLFMNMGPNATTFAMPAEVFHTRYRAAGSGLAAAAGKAGAALGTLLLPIGQATIGLAPTLTVVAGGCAVAAAVTFGLRGVLRAPASAQGTAPPAPDPVG